MNSIQNLGAVAACAEAGISPDFIPQLEGAFPTLSSPDAEPIGRLLLKGAAEVMRLSQYGGTAPALHLKLAATDPVWTEHSQELADHVSSVLQVLEPLERAVGLEAAMEKQALNKWEMLADSGKTRDRILSQGPNRIAEAAKWRLSPSGRESRATENFIKNHPWNGARKSSSFLKPGVEDAMELAGTGARTLGYGAVGAGGLLGALLWGLKRHSQQENADQESMKKQIGYYHNLSKELHESLGRKYDYGDEGEDNGSVDGNDKAEGVRPVYN